MITDKYLQKAFTERPIIWLVTHPYPDQDNTAWVLDEKEQSWNHIKTGWLDINDSSVGLPEKPWPTEIQEWVASGINPILYPINDFKYVSEKYKEWWKELYKNDLFRIWVLGWNPVTDINLKKQWKKAELEYKIMILETTIELKKKMKLRPTKDRFDYVCKDVISSVEKQENKLLHGVIISMVEEWKKEA